MLAGCEAMRRHAAVLLIIHALRSWAGLSRLQPSPAPFDCPPAMHAAAGSGALRLPGPSRTLRAALRPPPTNSPNTRPCRPAVESGVCIVTGSSRGIGAAIAKALGAQGCKVAVNYAGSKDKGGCRGGGQRAEDAWEPVKGRRLPTARCHERWGRPSSASDRACPLSPCLACPPGCSRGGGARD